MLGREESCVNEVVCYSFVLLTFWISLKTEEILIDFVCASSLQQGPSYSCRRPKARRKPRKLRSRHHLKIQKRTSVVT